MTRQVAVVAGATGTLGSAVVTALERRGLEVIGVARRTGGSAGIVAADLTSDGSVAAVSGAVDSAGGGSGEVEVRMVVHAAGPALAGGVTDVTPAAVLTAVDVKVNGLLRLVRGVDRHLVAGSRIVAVTGHLGYDPLPASVTAGVGNAALAVLVRQMARAYAPRGITCHAVAPGPVEGPRADRLVEHVATSSGWSRDEARERLEREAPVGRFAGAEDVAWAVSLLLDEAATMMSGSTLFLDGGRRTSIP